MSEKYLAGGYYDDRIFKGDFDYKTPYAKDISVFSLSDALELGFLSNIVEYCDENNSTGWGELTDDEKMEYIVGYTESDEIAGLELFETKEDAEKYVATVLEEIEEFEKHCVFGSTITGENNCFQDVYAYIAE